MSNIVEYILNLKDNLSNSLAGAAKQAEHLKGEMDGLGSKVMQVGAMFGIAFGAYKIGEFIHEGIEKFHELEQATAKVEANLKSTGMAAGITGEELKNMTSGLSGHIKASRSEITDMQSQLLTFPSITKDVFARSMGLVADIAAQTGHGLSDTGIMYGKALHNPIEGLQKLTRYGVMLTNQEKDRITKLQSSGHLIEAQKAMMDAIANSGYAGVAESMFNADPIARYNKLMEKAQLAIGEYAMEIMKAFMPTLESVAGGISSIVGFIKEYKGEIETLTVAYASYKFVMMGVAYWSGIQEAIVVQQALANMGNTGATITLTTAQGVQAVVMSQLVGLQTALNAAMIANPIGLIFVAVAALAVGFYELYQHCDAFRHGVNALWETVKIAVGAMITYWKALGEMIIGVLMAPFDKGSMFKKGLADLEDSTIGAAKRIGKAWDGHEAKKEEANKKWLADETKAVESVKSLYEQHLLKESTYKSKSNSIIATLDKAEKAGQITEEQKAKLLSLIPQKEARFGTGTEDLDKNTKPLKTKGESAKNVNIHIAYNQPLIKDFTISTTNIKEGLGKLKEMVTQILTDATHDSLIVAGE